MKKLFLVVFSVIIMSCDEPSQHRFSGAVFGTTYSIIYEGNRDLSQEFNRLFDEINTSMSTYIPNSIISTVNNSDSALVDDHFKTVFLSSKSIFEDTNGAFDPTIGAVVNAWDFGPKGTIEQLDSLKINRLMEHVGLEKVQLKEMKIVKPKLTQLDFNAIAKGYGVDVIAQFLESNSVKHYLIEIGGEIRCKGINTQKRAPWVVGVQNPNLDSDLKFVETVTLNNESMATSGTYRKFKIDENGRRYTHIINTKTGYPSRTNILSVSVITKDCMTADAYATALQTMPLDVLTNFLKKRPFLKVFIVYDIGDNDLIYKSFNNF